MFAGGCFNWINRDYPGLRAAPNGQYARTGGYCYPDRQAAANFAVTAQRE